MVGRLVSCWDGFLAGAMSYVSFREGIFWRLETCSKRNHFPNWPRDSPWFSPLMTVQEPRAPAWDRETKVQGVAPYVVDLFRNPMPNHRLVVLVNPMFFVMGYLPYQLVDPRFLNHQTISGPKNVWHIHWVNCTCARSIAVKKGWRHIS